MSLSMGLTIDHLSLKLEPEPEPEPEAEPDLMRVGGWSLTSLTDLNTLTCSLSKVMY